MNYKILHALSVMLFFGISFSLSCASELQGAEGTCINLTYTMLSKSQAYYSCSIITTNLWYYKTCTATVSTGTIKSSNNHIIAEWYSADSNKVSACLNHNGLICNVNPLYNFQTDMSLAYVGYCDSSEQTCVKCSESGIELKKFDGTGTIKTAINGAGNGLCESGCGADSNCDEQAQGYDIGNAGCTQSCKWQECRNYKWNEDSSLCYTSCTSNDECFGDAVCDLAIDANTCKVDYQAPNLNNYFMTDLTETPDDSLITGDEVMLSSYWSDNMYIEHAYLEIMSNGEWAMYDETENINSQSAWINYTISTSEFSEETVYWRITAFDRAQNSASTPTQEFYVYEKSADFNATLNLLYDDSLIFTGWASAEDGKKADNSASDELIGELTLSHNGRGISSSYSFKLNESLLTSIRIKISNEPNPQTAIILNENFQFPEWCQSQIRGDICQIWIWMDLDEGNTPNEYINKIVIENEADE